jgi:hypothetical protein
MHYIKGKTELLTSTPCITSRENRTFNLHTMHYIKGKTELLTKVESWGDTLSYFYNVFKGNR